MSAINEQKIWKYVFPDVPMVASWKMPHDARVVHVGLDPETGRVALWVRVTLLNNLPNQSIRERRFSIRGTGAVPLSSTYVGTVANGPYMWHVFEEALTIEIPRS